ncbi:MAG: glutamate-5-semialdehyde dehydrogenase [Oscillospiraceae bacterium]|nr:glutamate-5-semialdehyde dehydrogenase [Oscillospiraceae bacterium]
MLESLGIRAKSASAVLACATRAQKDKALTAIADALIADIRNILEANAQDLDAGRQSGLNDGLLDRLRLDEKRILGMADGLRAVAAAADPVGRVLWGETRPNGLQIRKVSVPLGVIAVIFEARPNVTADAAALCLKAGNAVILRGGKEAIRSNTAIARCMRKAAESAGLPADCIQLVEDTSRESANALMKMNDYVDVLIPRGGAGLIRAVVQNATVPVIETGTGNCHVYVDRDADLAMASDIVYNAKVSRPSVCNACESLLIHKDVADKAIPLICGKLRQGNVEIRGDETVCALVPGAVPATEADYATEFLDYIISVKVVDSLDEAIRHIAKNGTCHSECIVTENYTAAQTFQTRVDAAAVYVNASTRFTDGGEFGFGAEIGISTQKLHARGPLGLQNLTTEKYIILGNGQIRI